MFLTSWAELEVPLEAAVRDGDVFLADDREAKKAWCVDRQELFLCLTSELLQDKHTWTHRTAFQERDVCTLLLTKSILGLPGWIRAGYRGLETFVLHACSRQSNPSVSWTMGFGAAKLDICAWEGSLLAQFLTRWPGAALLGQSERQHALVDPGANFLTFHS